MGGPTKTGTKSKLKVFKWSVLTDNGVKLLLTLSC